MPNEYNDSDMRETNTQANETSTYFEASNSFLETDRVKEEADEAKEYGMDSDLAGAAGGNDDDNNNERNNNNSGSSNTSDTMNSLSSLTGGATAALSGAFASVIAVVAVVAVVPAMSSGYTPLTADFTSLTAIVREVEDEDDPSKTNEFLDICYTIELGSEDEEFEVTPELYSDISISLTNRYTDRTYTLEEMGGLSGRFEDVKEGTKYSVSLEYDGCLIGQQYITTSSSEQGPELQVYYRCNCSVDGTFHLLFFFGGDVSAFSNFSATLTDSYGKVSEWVPGDDFVDEMGSVIYTDVDADPDGDAYRFFFVSDDLEGEEADEKYAEVLTELDENGYIYVTAVQKINVINVHNEDSKYSLGGSSATLTITYDVYGDTQTIVVENVGI